MNQSNFCVEKALQAIYYLQSRTQITDKMSLVKLLFFADRFHIRHFCIPMLCDSYTAMRHGPVCSKTYDLIKKGQYYDYLSLTKRKFVAHNLFCKKKTIVTVLNTGDNELSASDKKSLDFSISNFAKFERKELSKISHAYPEWSRFKTVLQTEFSNAEEMSYLDFFDNPNPNDVYIKKYLNGNDPFDDDNERLQAFKKQYQLFIDNVSKIKKFSRYEKDWNGYGAEPINETIICRALDFLYQKATKQPKVFLTARSTVQFEWDSVQKRYLEIEVLKDRYIVYSDFDGRKSECETENTGKCLDEVEKYYA